MPKISDFLATFSESLVCEKLYQTKHLFALTLCLISISLTAVAAPADLDPTFGNGGKIVSSPDGSEQTFGGKMALQADGKIVMVGDNSSVTQIGTDFIVARYNSDGSPDMTFDSNGWTSTSFETDFAYATSVDIQADGKIVVGGTVRTWEKNNSLSSDFAIARYNSDGTLDTTFDSDGKLTISFNELLNFVYTEYLSVIKVGSDGKIVAAGTAINSAVDNYFVLTRINTDGSLDTTFGTGGKFVDQRMAGSNLDRITELIILSDGKIVASGNLITFIGRRRVVIKYGINGSREWTYSEGSSTTADWEAFNSIVLQADGKFIAVGKRNNKVVAIRINADGTEDNTFDTTAITPQGEAISAALQADGKIVANISTNNGSGFSLIRYNPDGTLDSDFGNGGIAYTTGNEVGRKLLIQPDGKILVGGYLVLSSPTRRYFALARYQGGNVVPQTPAFDYDGDGKSDISVYRPSDGVWYLNQSTNGVSLTQFGISTDRIVPSDFDGDGKTDIAIYRDGVWWMLQSSDSTVKVLQFGIAEDKPQSGDFDGDGKDDLVVFRPSNGVWYILRSSDNGFYGIQFGISEDIPQSADYDGDGITDLAVFRPSSGVWYLQKSLGGTSSVQFGLSGDIPTANDFDGDGNTDIAIYRPSNGDWYIINSSSNQVDQINFGISEDIPVSADYDGDTKADIAVFRPSNGVWYQMLSTTGWNEQLFGLSNDRPTPSAYNP